MIYDVLRAGIYREASDRYHGRGGPVDGVHQVSQGGHGEDPAQVGGLDGGRGAQRGRRPPEA